MYNFPTAANPLMDVKKIEKSAIVRERLAAARQTPLRAYRDMSLGGRGWGRLAWYEFLNTFVGPLPGALGFVLRRKLYPTLLGRAGRGFILGRSVTLRSPARIEIGDNVTIDDYSLLDGRGGEPGIVLGDNVIVNRNCMLQAKAGAIRLGGRTTIGSNSVIVSMAGIEFGEAVMVAGGVYVSAGAYRFDDRSRPIMDQMAFSTGPIRIGDDVWIGTGAVILDGVTIGRGAVIGAGAIVNKDIPEYAIAAGVPARVIRMRA
jgi:acetyltransferase-like isoleucine patch superfamily enzyme